MAFVVVGHRHINLRDIRAVLDAGLRRVGFDFVHRIDERFARDCAAINEHIARRERDVAKIKRHRLAIFAARRLNSRSRAAGRHGSAFGLSLNLKREAIAFDPIATLENLVQAEVRCRKVHISWFVGIRKSHRRNAAFDQLAVDIRRHAKVHAVLQAYGNLNLMGRFVVGHASEFVTVAGNNFAHDEFKRLAHVGLRKRDTVNRLHDVGHACGAIVRVAELEHATAVFVNALEQRLRGIIGSFDAEGELARMHRATIERLLHRKAAKAAVGLFLGIHVGESRLTVVGDLGLQSARMVVGHLNRHRAFMGVERDVARLRSSGIQRLAAVSVLDHFERVRTRLCKRQLVLMLIEVESLRPAIRQAAYRCLLGKIGAERVGRGLVSRHQAEPKAFRFGHRAALEHLCARNNGRGRLGAVFERERLRVARNSFRIGRGTLLRVRNAQFDMGIITHALALHHNGRLPHCGVIRHARQTLASSQVFRIDPRIVDLHHFSNFVDIRLAFRVTQVAQVECRLRERDASACRNRRHHAAVVNGGGFARHDLDAISCGQRSRSVGRFRHHKEHARLERALARCVFPRFRAARVPSDALVAKLIRELNAVVARKLRHNRFDRKHAIMLVGDNNFHLIQSLRHGDARVNGAHFFRFVNLVDIRARLRVHDVAEVETNLRARGRAFGLRYLKTCHAIACTFGHRSDHGRMSIFQQECEFIAGQPSAAVEGLRARKRS